MTEHAKQIDLTPKVTTLLDGTKVSWYTPQQLDAIRRYHVLNRIEQFFKQKKHEINPKRV